MGMGPSELQTVWLLWISHLPYHALLICSAEYVVPRSGVTVSGDYALGHRGSNMRLPQSSLALPPFPTPTLVFVCKSVCTRRLQSLGEQGFHPSASLFSPPPNQPVAIYQVVNEV